MINLYEECADLLETWQEQSDLAAANGQTRLATHLRNTAESLENILDRYTADAETEYWTAARDDHGNIRLSNGKGLLVAHAAANRELVQCWHAHAIHASDERHARQYQAALELIAREATTTAQRQWLDARKIRPDVTSVRSRLGHTHPRPADGWASFTGSHASDGPFVEVTDTPTSAKDRAA